MKFIKTAFILFVAVIFLSGCTKEKYTTEVLSDHLKVQHYDNREEYIFNEVRFTVTNDATYTLVDIMEMGDPTNIFTLAHEGDLVFFLLDNEIENYGGDFIVTKFDLPEQYKHIQDVGEFQIGYLTLPQDDPNRVEFIEKMDFRIEK